MADNPPEKPAPDSRESRLAAALRTNLRRRKALAAKAMPDVSPNLDAPPAPGAPSSDEG